jgi:magnesium-transporting ATPase (P-type)
MMVDLQKMEQEKGVLQWGGLAGILGAIIFIIVFVIVIVFVGSDITEMEGWIKKFPEIRAARTVENSLYLVTLILWVNHFLALYRALRGKSPAPALFGSVVGILGLVVLAVGALPHVATAPLSDLYHAPGATPVDQATLVLLWQATQGIFDALLITGLTFLPVGLIALGVAMFREPAFGMGYGVTTLLLGVAGVVAAGVLLVDPLSPIAVVGMFALIIFHLVLGWKVYSLSRAM